jgi:hypothetical protein
MFSLSPLGSPLPQGISPPSAALDPLADSVEALLPACIAGKPLLDEEAAKCRYNLKRCRSNYKRLLPLMTEGQVWNIGGYRPHRFSNTITNNNPRNSRDGIYSNGGEKRRRRLHSDEWREEQRGRIQSGPREGSSEDEVAEDEGVVELAAQVEEAVEVGGEEGGDWDRAGGQGGVLLLDDVGEEQDEAIGQTGRVLGTVSSGGNSASDNSVGDTGRRSTLAKATFDAADASSLVCFPKVVAGIGESIRTVSIVCIYQPKKISAKYATQRRARGASYKSIACLSVSWYTYVHTVS